jgi:DNA-binding GntR family transcriptional regulator
MKGSTNHPHKRPDNRRNALTHHENILSGLAARDRERAEAAVQESVKQWAILSS